MQKFRLSFIVSSYEFNFIVIMKKVILVILSLGIFSCASTSNAQKEATKHAHHKAENQHSKVSDTTQSKPDILIGKQNRKALEQKPFSDWFNLNYKEYKVDNETASKLTPYLKDVSIKAFMGTWCGDSKRETPTFYKILDHIDFDYNNLELITVTREKNTPEGFEKDLDIKRVPTFIFYKGDKELGRYVEFARETLEKDILDIVSGKPYKHSYQD